MSTRAVGTSPGRAGRQLSRKGLLDAGGVLGLRMNVGLDSAAEPGQVVDVEFSQNVAVLSGQFESVCAPSCALWFGTSWE